MVDVVAKLEDLAAKHKETLNWKVRSSIFLSFSNRQQHDGAKGAGQNPDVQKMGDSAQMNIWLHKTVLKKLADNGGNIPKELLG